jgi:hypothetical protein
LSRTRTKALIGLVVVAAAAVSAYPISNTWGICGASVSPGPAAFTTPVAIVMGGVSGDQILSVHEGRDDQGPYCAIEWVPGPGTNNSAATLAALGQGTRTLPYVGLRGLPGGPGTPPANPPAQPSFFITYRPTNDPINPGWAAPPAVGAVGQLELCTIACHQFAEAMRSMVRFAYALTPPPAPFLTPQTYPPITVAMPHVSVPVFYAEVNVTVGSPAFCEFYKYDIDTL